MLVTHCYPLRLTVITALHERSSYFLDDGSPRKKGFQLELKPAA